MTNYDILNQVEKSYDFCFANYTTYGLGGKAKIAYFPKTEQEAVAVFDYLNNLGEKFVILGNGSNVLASDKLYDGAVISTKYLKGIEKRGDTLYCLSGTTVQELLKYCLENGLGGLEYLAGIPASLGGLALMNGGIPSRHIESDVQSVTIFDGEIRNLSNKNCNFGNKHSTMRDVNCLILGVNLSIYAVPREAAQKKLNDYLEVRKHQPKGKNCGCVFKNFNDISAGKLIDESGLKGLKIGQAEVSDFHANFIVNNGTSAQDVYSLIKLVQKKVFESTQVKLEEEVVYIGEFNETDS